MPNPANCPEVHTAEELPQSVTYCLRKAAEHPLPMTVQMTPQEWMAVCEALHIPFTKPTLQS